MDAWKVALNWMILTGGYLYFNTSCVNCQGDFGFNGQNYLALDVTLGKQDLNAFTLEMRFKSYKKDGLILIQRCQNLMQFYSVSLVNKHVVFWLNSSKFFKIESIHPVQYDNWNNLTLTKTNRRIRLTLNDHPVVKSEKLGGWPPDNICLSEELYLGGYHTPSVLTLESPTILPFSGCVRELTFRGRRVWYSLLYKEYRLSLDTVMVDKLRGGLLKSCDMTELCNFTLTAWNLTDNLNQLCHWTGSEVTITAELIRNCSSDPQIAYQWTVHYLYGLFTTISEFSKSLVLPTTPLNRSSLTLTVGSQQADLTLGVYGVNLTVVLNSAINATVVTVLGYFVVGCSDVTNVRDQDCSYIQDIITHDIMISTKLSNTSRCKGQSVVTRGNYSHPTEFWELEQEATNILLNSSTNTTNEQTNISLNSATNITNEQALFQLKCLSNCDVKAVPGQTLVLQSLCVPCTSHAWTVYGCGTQCDVLIGADPPQNGSKFSISVNESYEYQEIFYTGIFPSGRNESVQYNLTVNLPPTPGNCTITPQSGYSLVTAFNVSCQGFTDPDLPLTYVVYQRQPSGKETELMKSDEAVISPLYLSEGPGEDNYTQRLSVRCIDSEGLMSATPITVQVQPLETNPGQSLDVINVISESVLGNSSSAGILNDLLAAGKQSAVTQVLRSSVVTLNKDVESSPGDQHRQEQRTQIRGALVAVLVNSSSGPPESIDINAITSVLNTATEVQEELSEETQDKAVELYDGMTTAFSTQSVNVTQSAAETTAGLLLEGITMLLDTKTKSGYKALHSGPANDTLERQVKSSAEKLLGTVNTITDVMMEFIKPDANPSVFTTSKMNLALSKASPSQLAMKELNLSRGNNYGDFTIPADSKLSVLLSNTSYASIQVMLTEKNPFIWDLSSDNLTTPMVSMTLRNDQQQIVNVTDLTDPVQIFISNTNPTAEKSEENFTINAASFDSFNSTPDDLCRVLNLNVTKKRSNILTIQPLTFNLSISAMEIQNGTNVSHYDITSAGISLNKANNFTHIFTSLPSGVIAIGFCVDQTMDNYRELNKGCLSLTSCVLTLTLEIQGYSAVCMYWNVSGDAWSSGGCQVGRQTTPETIHCECNHLTAFSGSFLVAPNFVDPFGDASLFLTFFSNPVVVSTVLIIWLIYFTLLTWATKQDRRDMYRGGVIVAHENDPNNRYAYLVCVITGWWKDAGTSANVSLSFSGTRGHSARHCLSESVPGRQCFMSGSEDWFLITTSHSLGDIKSLSVWHDNSGKSPAWYLSRILIEDLQSQKTWTFLYSDWISVDRGSVSLKITLQSCSDEELMSHKNQQFFFKSSRDLRDSHLWLSIASKPSYSTFTRVQRLSCALCLLLMTMLTSLMFHGIPTDDPADQAKVGYLTVSLSDLVIGVQSGLIMFPVNILIIQLFLKSKRKPRGGAQVKKKARREKYSVVSVGTSEGDQTSEKEMEPAKENGILPWWTVYIAWTLVITLSVVSSYFVMLYGLKFGYQKSVEWLVSFFTAFFQSAFVTQPLKVIAISLIFTMILKKPVEIQGGKTSSEEKKEQYRDIDRRQGYYVPDPLSQRLMNRIRRQLKLEEATQATLRDIMLYLTFIICIIFMAHGHRSVRDSYRVHKFLENTFVQPRHPPIYIDGSGYSTDILELDNVANVELFWSYIEERIVPVLGEMSLGNSAVATSISEYYLLGSYRLRQVRIKQDTCDFPDVLRKSFSISLDCTGEYWVGDEDTGDYNLTWRKPLPNKVKSIPDTWSHQSSWKLKTIPYEGRLATYSGGGYTVVLAGNVTQSLSVIHNLQNSDWIDLRTRAVFIEFTTYNANVNLFSVILILFEFSNIGAIFPSYQIFTTKLYGYDNGLEIFTAVCEVFFVIFTLTFSYIEIRKLYYGGRTQYFSDPWSFVEIIQIILSFSVIGLFFQRFVSVSSTLSDYLTSTEFVSFYTAISWDMILNYVMAFLVALVILKFFKFLKFNARMYLLSQTLSIARANLIGFSVIIFLVVVGFGHFAVLAFGPSIEGFMDMGKTLITLFRLALGESDFPSLQQANRYLGPVFFFLYIFLVQWTVLVVFIAILNFAIEEAKRNIAEMRNKLEVVDYIYNKIYQLLPRCS